MSSLIDPATIIGEILGEPAASMRNPANAEYQCPFTNSTCRKQGHAFTPYPVCSVWAGRRAPILICACPVRFYGASLINDIVENCWPGDLPTNLRTSYEVKMEKFGNVDMVLSDIDPDTGRVLQFVSVELQAMDFTGSVEHAYSALINNEGLRARPKSGPNWANVRKRLVSQLITKGFFHHHWQTRMVCVLQTPMYNRLRYDVPFKEWSDIRSGTDIVFLLYDYVRTAEGDYILQFDRVVGTSHNEIMMAPIYQQVPDKEAFHKKILAQLR